MLLPPPISCATAAHFPSRFPGRGGGGGGAQTSLLPIPEYIRRKLRGSHPNPELEKRVLLLSSSSPPPPPLFAISDEGGSSSFRISLNSIQASYGALLKRFFSSPTFPHDVADYFPKSRNYRSNVKVHFRNDAPRHTSGEFPTFSLFCFHHNFFHHRHLSPVVI